MKWRYKAVVKRWHPTSGCLSATLYRVGEKFVTETTYSSPTGLRNRGEAKGLMRRVGRENHVALPIEDVKQLAKVVREAERRSEVNGRRG